MSYNHVDYEAETDLQEWLRVTREAYGQNVVTEIIGADIYQNGYEYIKEIVATLDGKRVAAFVFNLPNSEDEIYNEQAA
jgi:hypothetical protein